MDGFHTTYIHIREDLNLRIGQQLLIDLKLVPLIKFQNTV